MTEISAEEISKYETIGFVVLKKRVHGTLVQNARDAVAVRIEDTRKTVKENTIFTTVYEDKNWPPECQALFEEIEKSVPSSLFCPPNSILRIGSRIGVYQPNEIKARGAPNAVFFTTPLNEEKLVSGVNMPGYYERSHIDSSSIERTKEDLTLEDGDVLVWNGKIAMKTASGKAAGFMLIKHFWE